MENQKRLQSETEKPIPAKYHSLINRYLEILHTDFKTEEPKHGVFYKIETGSNPPCHAKVRPILPGSPRAIQGEKDWRELERLGIPEKVNPKDSNVWTSPINQVPKPDGSMRNSGDFIELSSKTLLDGYPLQNLKFFTGKIRGASLMARIDLVKAYHQIPLDEESKKKTCVVTAWGEHVNSEDY